MVDKSEKFGTLVRLGFAARGIVYILIGFLFLFGRGHEADAGPQSAFNWIQDTPGGTLVLYACAIGLLAYGLYRLASLAFDVENEGGDAKGWATRIGHGASGIAHLVLAWTAVQFARGSQQTASDGQTQESVQSVLSVDLGPVLLGLVGLGFLVAVYDQAKKAITNTVMDRVSGRAPTWVEPIGRAGYAARAVVFLLIGWSLIKAGWFASSAQAKSIGTAIASLRDDGPLFTVVALGILLFGLFTLTIAPYRIVPDIDPTRDLRKIGR